MWISEELDLNLITLLEMRRGGEIMAMLAGLEVHFVGLPFAPCFLAMSW